MARIIDGSEMNLIGNNLKKLRQERGWSQQLLSDKLENGCRLYLPRLNFPHRR